MQEGKPTAQNFRAIANAVLSQLRLDWKQAQVNNNQARVRANTSTAMIEYFIRLSNIKDVEEDN